MVVSLFEDFVLSFPFDARFDDGALCGRVKLAIESGVSGLAHGEQHTDLLFEVLRGRRLERGVCLRLADWS